MTISYKLNIGGKAVAQWSVENRPKPSSQIAFIPKDILLRDELKTYFRRAKVVSRTETKRGFCVQLEAVRMSFMDA